jgi:hypothetical protein
MPTTSYVVALCHWLGAALQTHSISEHDAARLVVLDHLPELVAGQSAWLPCQRLAAAVVAGRVLRYQPGLACTVLC